MTTMNKSEDRRRWWALYVLCMGSLMIVLDATIVTVALPSIRDSLGFSQTSLAWVVNAYLITFGGFMLLGGRLGDLYGHRKLFLIGLFFFILTSLACGVAPTQWLLVSARALQGIAGAVVDSIALSLIMDLFPEPTDRAKAMGVFGAVCASGGSIGVLLGGVLTSSLDWHWVFLVNLPVGIAVILFTLKLVPSSRRAMKRTSLDIGGAVTITAALMIAVYAMLNGNDVGWLTVQTLGLLSVSVLLIILFLFIEKRILHPLVMLSLFRLRNLATANVISMLWAAGMFAQSFFTALYLQLVLHYNPMQVGLAFLPSNVAMAILSFGVSARVVSRFGIKPPLFTGVLMSSAGLALLALVPVGGTYLVHVLPGTMLIGLGAGIAFNPIMLAAMNDAPADQSGLASGLVNTSFMIGGALGLATLASIAAWYTGVSSANGLDHNSALTAGFDAAFLAGALLALLAGALGVLLRTSSASAAIAPHSAAVAVE